ncbi:MAG: DnaJ domain-containing protein [bacterium]
MAQDYYQILGVSNEASQDDIKKAFRRLAHQYHPDKKEGNEQKFKEINEAYQILSNSKKRQQYDYGQASGGFGSDYGGGFGDFAFNFGSFFNLNDLLRDIFQRSYSQPREVISIPIELSLEQALNGGIIERDIGEGRLIQIKIIPPNLNNRQKKILEDMKL